MPIKCKKGKPRYRRIRFKGKHKHYLQLAYCPVKGKKKGKLKEAKLKTYRDRIRLSRMI